MINKPLEEVIAHLFDAEIHNRWNTRSTSLVELTPITGQVNLSLGIVGYDHLVIITLLSCKEGVKRSFPDVGHSHLISERFAGHLVFDQ